MLDVRNAAAVAKPALSRRERLPVGGGGGDDGQSGQPAVARCCRNGSSNRGPAPGGRAP